ncbi:MAG: response regulator [Robiginitomaculum sp.]|nr:response regulator [Robiginitomaculum sp.]MBN4051732.1 response regulator [Parvibaculum lavamentivorans]
MRTTNNLPTIMVVDDDEDFVEELSETLEMRGWNTRPATSGAAAIRHLESADNNIGVVISDLHMPSIGGLRLVRELQARYGSDCPEIIFISGHRDVDSLVTALRLQVADFLAKPINTGELVSAVEQAVDRLRRREKNTPSQGQTETRTIYNNKTLDPLRLLLDLNQIVAARFDQESLDHHQVRILADLAWEHRAGKRVTVTGLSYGLNVSAGTMHRKLKSLEDMDLISRQDDQNDGRLAYINLTDNGHLIVQHLAQKLTDKIIPHAE